MTNKRSPGKKRPATVDPFPPIYLEALAYHEAGHAVMAVLLGVPFTKVAIGPGCDDPDFNGRVFLDLEACPKLPIFKFGLLEVASEAAEKLSPNFDQFGGIHKAHRHLKPFRSGVRNDIARGFEAVMVVYYMLQLAESTAKQRFKVEYRDVAAGLIRLNSDAVIRLANKLQTDHNIDGEAATAIILADGPLKDGGLLRDFGLSE